MKSEVPPLTVHCRMAIRTADIAAPATISGRGSSSGNGDDDLAFPTELHDGTAIGRHCGRCRGETSLKKPTVTVDLEVFGKRKHGLTYRIQDRLIDRARRQRLAELKPGVVKVAVQQ